MNYWKQRRIDRLRAARIATLQTELNVQGERSVERTRTIETKAAYAVTAAAIVVGACISILTTATLISLIVLIPLTLATITIVNATRAIRPLTLEVPDARSIINAFLDNPMSPLSLADHLLEVRTEEVTKRDNLNVIRARAMTLSFRWLTLSFIALAIAALVSGVATSRMDDHEKPKEARPAKTNSAAEYSGGFQAAYILERRGADDRREKG